MGLPRPVMHLGLEIRLGLGLWLSRKSTLGLGLNRADSALWFGFNPGIGALTGTKSSAELESG